MKKVKLHQAVLIPKKGTYNKGQIVECTDDYAKHIIENMKAGELIEAPKQKQKTPKK